MLNVGIGEQQINNVLAELNLPAIHHKTLKQREREVGRAFEKVAESSCNAAILSEMSFSGDSQVSCDGGWQRRGTGLNYDSLSGHVTVVGSSTKKCIAYGIANKTCRKCHVNLKTKGKANKSHVCRRNWCGSAKGMEPFLTIKCLKDLQKKGLDVKKIVMDDDSTTFSRAKKALSPQLTKASDKNHVVRNFSNSLYKLRTQNKNIMSTKTISYFKKCFTYAIEQNKGDEHGLRTNLEAIVPHAFGNHDKCNDKWCGYIRNPSTFRHKSLPFGKDLEGDDLKKSLNKVFQKQIDNVKKLVDLDSSNANENLNQLIAKKAPKAQHYSGSESLSYRVSAAIAQKNEGHQYLLQVNSECNLSPGKKTEVRLKRLDKKRLKKKERQTKRETKLNRLTSKQNRHTAQKLHEISEGTTYERDVGFSVNINEDDLLEIPVFSSRSSNKTDKKEPKNVIIIDLETTGFSHGNEIIQVAAKTLEGQDIFSKFVQPENGFIPPLVSKLTGIEIHGYQMYHHLIPVYSCSKKSALSEFTSWLKRYQDPLLVAHNAPYDSRVLVQAYVKSGMESDLECIGGFVDSIKTFKEVYPGKVSYKLGNLASELAPTFSFDAHSADGDVNVLHHLLEEIPNVHQMLKKCVVSVEDVKKNNQKITNKHKHIKSYVELVEKKVISKAQSESLASSGLNSEHIRIAYHRGGREGLLAVLKGKVTKTEQVATRLGLFYD
ncbi:hypothetical protein FSP39_012922 [Pinctada imbricata]|uniref:Exonuclease domain-containing protein n=1 Tax=Pinctada imbricata TaxID=66713 RepID=A0AA88XK54_PINIB|nr:hypothetical protein FSP39_012922 [Pinctada imbricata]